MTRWLLPFALGIVTGAVSLALLILSYLGYRYSTREE